MNTQTEDQTTGLTASAVDAIFKDCLFRSDEITNGEPNVPRVTADGIMNKFGFHEGRVKAHSPAIRALLDELPAEFTEGWSFLNACMDKHGRQWGEHQNIEQLFALGVATGDAVCLMPREMWPMLPGGMPYFQVKSK